MTTAEVTSDYDRDATLGVGVNLAHDLAINEAVANAPGVGLEDGGGGGGGVFCLPTPTRLVSFGVYWDNPSKSLQMVEPQVIGPKGTITCAAPAQITKGTLYCNVRHVLSSDTYTATIESAAAEAESGKEVVASVKIFTLDDNSFTQHHMGTIIVSAASTGGAEYIAGDDTNIVFTKATDADGNETGKIKVDVYYK